MRAFIDLQGQSGATYRFRAWPAGAAHLPIAGNYACVRDEPSGLTVLMVGECPDLSLLRTQLPKTLTAGEVEVFTRLNVSRATRCAEHEDLAARYKAARRKAATV